MAVGAGFTAADYAARVGRVRLGVWSYLLVCCVSHCPCSEAVVWVCICVHGWRCVLRFVCSEVPGVCALVCRVLHVLCWFGVR